MIQFPQYTAKVDELQKAVVTSLRNVLEVPVYDYVPEKSTLPYVVIGTISIVPYRTKVIAAIDVTIQIETWSTYSGFAETERLIDGIIQTLTGETLKPEGISIVDVIWDTCNLTAEPTETEVLRHGQIVFRWRLC